APVGSVLAGSGPRVGPAGSIGGEGRLRRQVPCGLPAQRLGEEGQADVHAVVDARMVVGKFLVAMRYAARLQGPVDAAGAVEDVVLVLGAAIEEEALDAADGVGVGLDQAGGVPGEPVGPAFLDQFAGVEGDG